MPTPSRTALLSISAALAISALASSCTHEQDSRTAETPPHTETLSSPATSPGTPAPTNKPSKPNSPPTTPPSGTVHEGKVDLTWKAAVGDRWRVASESTTTRTDYSTKPPIAPGIDTPGSPAADRVEPPMGDPFKSSKSIRHLDFTLAVLDVDADSHPTAVRFLIDRHDCEQFEGTPSGGMAPAANPTVQLLPPAKTRFDATWNQNAGRWDVLGITLLPEPDAASVRAAVELLAPRLESRYLMEWIPESAVEPGKPTALDDAGQAAAMRKALGDRATLTKTITVAPEPASDQARRWRTCTLTRTVENGEAVAFSAVSIKGNGKLLGAADGDFAYTYTFLQTVTASYPVLKSRNADPYAPTHSADITETAEHCNKLPPAPADSPLAPGANR